MVTNYAFKDLFDIVKRVLIGMKLQLSGLPITRSENGSI